MTREEASFILANIDRRVCDDDLSEALDMAIEALEQEPCEDAISRRAVIDTIDTTDKFMDEERTVENYKALLKECYEVLPSVTPKQKMCFDGMTNGEVIDSLFPNMDIYHNRDFTLREMVFPDEWWDAPYKAESESDV